MRSQETHETRDNGGDVFFSSLDCHGKRTVLQCLIDIASSFKKQEYKPIPVHTVTSPLIVLEKNLGHNSIPFVLESMGVVIDKNILSLTNDSSHIKNKIKHMHSIVQESELNTDCKKKDITAQTGEHVAKRIHQLYI
jgi:hypothetical protein